MIRSQLDESENYGAVILAVAHHQFLKIDLKSFRDRGAIIYDVKGILPRDLIHARL